MIDLQRLSDIEMAQERKTREGLTPTEILDVARRVVEAADAVPLSEGTDALEWCEACRRRKPVSLSRVGGRWLFVCNCTRRAEETWIALRDLKTTIQRGQAAAHFAEKIWFDYADFVCALARYVDSFGDLVSADAEDNAETYGYAEGLTLDNNVARVTDAVEAARGMKYMVLVKAAR